MGSLSRSCCIGFLAQAMVLSAPPAALLADEYIAPEVIRAEADAALSLRGSAGAATTAVQPWQGAISGQIEAFREQDAPAAYGLAATGFRVAFPNAEMFLQVILASGYAPIMNSWSHSFGGFRQLDGDLVVQEVSFIGSDQSIYSAVYEVIEEPAGWRVLGVRLARPRGMAI